MMVLECVQKSNPNFKGVEIDPFKPIKFDGLKSKWNGKNYSKR